MTRALSKATVIVVAVAILAGIAFYLLTLLGGTECEIYCGPGGLLLPFGLAALAAACWIAGLWLSIAGLVRSRARARSGWIGIVLSVFVPVAVTVLYVTSH